MKIKNRIQELLNKNRIHELFNMFVAILFLVNGIAGIVFIFFEAKWPPSDLTIPLIYIILSLMFAYLVIERPSMDYIKDLIVGDKVKTMKTLMNGLDSVLKEVFEDEIKSNIEFYTEAIEQNTIKIDSAERFKIHYVSALKRYSKAKIVSTSLPSKKYFWSNNLSENNVESELADFIARGGKNERVFLLERKDDINSAEIREILDFQKKEMGVDVFTVLSCEVPQNYQSTFFVLFKDSKKRFAWSANVGPTGNVCNFRFTVNDKQINDFNNAYLKIKNASSFKKYE